MNMIDFLKWEIGLNQLAQKKYIWRSTYRYECHLLLMWPNETEKLSSKGQDFYISGSPALLWRKTQKWMEVGGRNWAVWREGDWSWNGLYERRIVSKDKTWMADKPLKMFNILSLREIQIEATFRFYPTPLSFRKTLKLTS